MAAITAAAIAIVGLALGWITIEMACKPCLDRGREAIDRSLNPDYDPDEENANNSIRAPLNPNPNSDPDPDPKNAVDAATSTNVKVV